MTEIDNPQAESDDGEAARWARREPLLVLLGRLTRGTLQVGERALLRAAVETELADGDQAHDSSQITADFAEAGKQLPRLYGRLTKALSLPLSASWDDVVATAAEARSKRFSAHDIEVCNRERTAHEAHRLALSTALHLGTSAPWDAIQDRAETVQAGDAPWVRAYGEDIAAAEERADRAEAMLARVREIAEPATRYDDVSQDKLASSILAALDPVPEPHVDWRDIAAQREDTIGRVRALAVRLDGFAALALTEPDRRLYAALASDVRAALTGPHAAETAAQPDDADRIVADRGRDGRLYCTRCTPPSGEPLTSEDLPDGGICTACGTDVLAAPEPMARELLAEPNLAAIRQSAYDAVSAYISTLPSEGVTALPSSTVTRNAMIWRGVNAALDAEQPVDPTVTVTMPASASAALRVALGGAA